MGRFWGGAIDAGEVVVAWIALLWRRLAPGAGRRLLESEACPSCLFGEAPVLQRPFMPMPHQLPPMAPCRNYESLSCRRPGSVGMRGVCAEPRQVREDRLKPYWHRARRAAGRRSAVFHPKRRW